MTRPAALPVRSPPTPGAVSAAASPLSTGRQAMLALLWFAMFAQWMSIVPVVVPEQVARMVGADAPGREALVGTIVGAGAWVALLVAPLAGAWSDGWRGRRGRRRPFLVAGCVGTAVALPLLEPATRSGPWLYALAFLNLQLWWNVVSGAYAGLVPDVVAPAERGAASAWLNVMTVLGTLAGNALLAIAWIREDAGLRDGTLVALMTLCLVATLAAVREPSSAAAPPGPGFLDRVLRQWPRPAAQPAFWWVMVTRFMANMGVWSILTFLLFYLGDVVGAADPQQLLALLLGVGSLLAVPASLAGAKAAARWGNVPVVRWTSIAMALCTATCVAIAAAPSLWLAAPVVLVFAATWGAYQAVDWSLALETLPSLDNAGRDMGFWHVAMVLPQIVGPVSSGWLISGIKATQPAPVAYTAAFALAALWFVLAAWLVGRVRTPARAERG